jgi:hypothetical protein
MTQLPSNDLLVPYERFGPYAVIMRDVGDGRLYMQLSMPEGVKVTRWNCICHPKITYRRPHFTCLLFCRTKRMVQSKLPPLIPVSRYLMYVPWTAAMRD